MNASLPTADILSDLLAEVRDLRAKQALDRNRPSNVGVNDILSVPEAARWTRVDEARLRKLLTQAGVLHTGLGPARVIASDVLAVLKGEPSTTAQTAPVKVKRRRRKAPPGSRTVAAHQPLPRLVFDES